MTTNQALKDRVISLRVKKRMTRNAIWREIDGAVNQTTIGRWLKEFPLSQKEFKEELHTAYRRRRRTKPTPPIGGWKGRPRKPRSACLMCGDLCKSTKTRFCSQRCYSDHRAHQYVTEWKEGKQAGCKPGDEEVLSNYIRNYLIEQSGDKCSLCGWNKVNPSLGHCPLQVDHIDGNSRNHRPENLRVVCPNCHSLSPHHMILNRGRGRRNRRPPPKDLGE